MSQASQRVYVQTCLHAAAKNRWQRHGLAVPASAPLRTTPRLAWDSSKQWHDNSRLVGLRQSRQTKKVSLAAVCQTKKYLTCHTIHSLSCSVTLEKKRESFFGKTILVGQPPKKKGGTRIGATEPLSSSLEFPDSKADWA